MLFLAKPVRDKALNNTTRAEAAPIPVSALQIINKDPPLVICAPFLIKWAKAFLK